MGWLSPRIRGRADGKVASGLVAQALARADLSTYESVHDTGHEPVHSPRAARPTTDARPSAEPTINFTRRDAGRLIAASVVLLVAMSVILGLDVLPAQRCSR